jgi:hypothetical protein
MDGLRSDCGLRVGKCDYSKFEDAAELGDLSSVKSR